MLVQFFAPMRHTVIIEETDGGLIGYDVRFKYATFWYFNSEKWEPLISQWALNEMRKMKRLKKMLDFEGY